MTKQTRRKYSPEFKAKVTLEAIKNLQTLAELATKFEVDPVMISKWKAEFLENMSAAFAKGWEASAKEEDRKELNAQIGQLKVEIKFLKACQQAGKLQEVGDTYLRGQLVHLDQTACLFADRAIIYLSTAAVSITDQLLKSPKT